MPANPDFEIVEHYAAAVPVVCGLALAKAVGTLYLAVEAGLVELKAVRKLGGGSADRTKL